jgi:hypothetical protein
MLTVTSIVTDNDVNSDASNDVGQDFDYTSQLRDSPRHDRCIATAASNTALHVATTAGNVTLQVVATAGNAMLQVAVTTSNTTLQQLRTQAMQLVGL